MTIGNGLSGVILAGGGSRRMGRDKALLGFGGQPLIAVIAGRLRSVADEVLVVAEDGLRYAPFADRWVGALLLEQIIADAPTRCASASPPPPPEAAVAKQLPSGGCASALDQSVIEEEYAQLAR